jgi:hypothetical protein
MSSERSEPGFVIDTVAKQIQSEFLESPGLRLSPVQIQRLWRLDGAQCLVAVKALVDIGFLRQARDGTYVRSG